MSSDPIAEFVALQALTRNLRSVLPPMTDGQSQLVGLYLLNAYHLGHGVDFTTFPPLPAEKPKLHIVPAEKPERSTAP